MFGGAFIAGWLSFSGNSLIDIMNSQWSRMPTVFNKWTDALTAPFSGWFFKALVAFCGCLDGWQERSKRILIAGLGFWFSNHWGFRVCCPPKPKPAISRCHEAINGSLGGLASTCPLQLLYQLCLPLLSQWPSKRKTFLGSVCSLNSSQSLLNSPFYETDHRINLLVGLLFAVQVGTFTQVVLYTKHPVAIFKTIRKFFKHQRTKTWVLVLLFSQFL